MNKLEQIIRDFNSKVLSDIRFTEISNPSGGSATVFNLVEDYSPYIDIGNAKGVAFLAAIDKRSKDLAGPPILVVGINWSQGPEYLRSDSREVIYASGMFRPRLRKELGEHTLICFNIFPLITSVSWRDIPKDDQALLMAKYGFTDWVSAVEDLKNRVQASAVVFHGEEALKEEIIKWGFNSKTIPTYLASNLVYLGVKHSKLSPWSLGLSR